VAAVDQQAHGDVVSVYRCLGGLAWHLTAHGSVAEALRSTRRRLAYEFLHGGFGHGGAVDPDVFLTAAFGVPGGPRQRCRSRAERCIEQMIARGLVHRTGAGTLRAADRAVQVGLDAYLEER
jgi:hypothetical protein